MASGATVKMGVDVTQFKQGMQQAQQSAKTLNAQMKANENQFKATGDKEKYLTEKGKLLKEQLEAQKTAAANAEKALEAMRKNGVEKTNADYQKLEQSLAGAQAAMYDTQAAMNALSTSEGKAADGANDMATNLNSISKKVSFDAVITGIDKITGGLEKAAQKAAQLGQSIWDEIVNSAKWADDMATLAVYWDVPLEKLLQMEALVASGLDTTAESVFASMQKMRSNIGKGSKDAMDALKQLGLVVTQYGGKTEQGFDKLVTEDQDELFFMAGQAIMNMSDAYEQEAAAMAIFGKSWRELRPLFTDYKDAESFNKALEGTTTNTEEEVNKLAELNDKLGALEQNFQTLKNTVLSTLAPALSNAAEVLSGLLQSVMEYLQTPEGQKALQDMETAVSGLFEDLKNIDPAQVVEGFTTVFNTIVSGLQWMVEHKEELAGILTVIVGGWAAAKITGGALDVLKLINGVRGLTGKGTPSPIVATPSAQNATAAAGGGGATAASGVSGAKTVAGKKVDVSGGTSAPAAGTSSTGTTAIINPANGKIVATGAFQQFGEEFAASHPLADKVINTIFSPQGLAALGIIAGIPLAAKAAQYVETRDAGVAKYGEGYKGLTHRQKQIADGNAPLDNGNYENLDDVKAAAEKQKKIDKALMPEWLRWTVDLSDAVDNTAEAIAGTAAEIYNIGKEAVNLPFEVLNAAIFNDSHKGQMVLDMAGMVLGGAAQKAGGFFGTIGKMADIVGGEAEKKAQTWAIEAAAAVTQDFINPMKQSINDIFAKTYQMMVQITPTGNSKFDYFSPTSGGGTTTWFSRLVGTTSSLHANGLFSVPWDGYPAILHKGERVLTARENQQYTYNNYFGNVNLNNGLEIEALTESIDRRNRRQRSGYGAA